MAKKIDPKIFNDMEQGFLCGAINNTDSCIYADQDTLPFFKSDFATSAVNKAVASGRLTFAGKMLATAILKKLGSA